MVLHVVNVCSKAVFGLFLCHALTCSVRHSIPTHHSLFVAFFQEFFNNYCCTNLYCYANFSIVSDKTSAGQKSLRGEGQLPQGIPFMDDSQHFIVYVSRFQVP